MATSAPAPAPYSKPYLPVTDQVALLQSRGMKISELGKASLCLERIGYYRLSGYWYSWREVTPPNPPTQPKPVVHDHFKRGAEFKHVIDLYVFDKKLRLLFLDGIERIEVGIRSEIALLLGRYSPTAHRNVAYLSRKFTTATKEHADWIARLDYAYGKSKEDFIKHHKKTYQAPLPLWIAVELWDFGMLSYFLGGMRDSDLDILATKYGFPRRDLLTSWVRSMNFVRNVCAHHSRLWNRSMIDQPKAPASGAITELDHLANDTYAQERLYGVAVAIRYLLRTINPTTSWGERLGTLLENFPSAPGISIRNMGFPSDWQNQALWP